MVFLSARRQFERFDIQGAYCLDIGLRVKAQEMRRKAWAELGRSHGWAGASKPRQRSILESLGLQGCFKFLMDTRSQQKRLRDERKRLRDERNTLVHECGEHMAMYLDHASVNRHSRFHPIDPAIAKTYRFLNKETWQEAVQRVRATDPAFRVIPPVHAGSWLRPCLSRRARRARRARCSLQTSPLSRMIKGSKQDGASR